MRVKMTQFTVAGNLRVLDISLKVITNFPRAWFLHVIKVPAVSVSVTLLYWLPIHYAGRTSCAGGPHPEPSARGTQLVNAKKGRALSGPVPPKIEISEFALHSPRWARAGPGFRGNCKLAPCSRPSGPFSAWPCRNAPCWWPAAFPAQISPAARRRAATPP